MIPQLLIQLHICFLLILIPPLLVEADPPIAKPGCKDTCGGVKIPFPFGIGANCSLDHSFEINCTGSPSSNGSTKPFLYKFNIEVLELNLDDENDYGAPSVVVAIPPPNMCSTGTQHQQQKSIDLRRTPYNFSTSYNVFIMEGCAGSAVLVNQSQTIMAGCATICHNNKSAMSTSNCYGVNCCQSPMPSESDYSYSPLQYYQIDFDSPSEGEQRPCLVATLIKSDSVKQYVGKLSTSNPSSAVPVVLYWYWMSNQSPEYNPHVTCNRENNLYCYCKGNYYGNPYVPNGCQVPEECKRCHGYCYPKSDGNSYYCERTPRFTLAAILGLSIGLGSILLVIGCYGLYRFIKRRREMKRRAKFFKRNGGLLLQQQLSSNEGVVERTKIFTIDELDKATDHFNENRILGQGGQGTVFKGMLSDGRIVAIKKAKLLDETQLEQFINEVVILSQINHRNVVKLLGCCLETEIPLLVYEFIPNGTLFQHIHNPDRDFIISWEMRLKIATDSSAAIAYLHSSSSIPIYHRDIKSSNILLDERNRAKVSDFGSSRTIAIDQTHLTTIVQGTMGYLDPEYFQSYQFTEKSDVYSFGVVLLELLTGKKPIYRVESMEQKNLVTEFLFLMQNFRLSEILDLEILKEAKEEQLTAVIGLANRCLSWSGKLRPTMKEVAMILEMIIKSPAHVTLNQEALMKEAVEEPVMMKKSDMDISESWSSMYPADASSSCSVDGQPLLFDTA